MLIDYRKSISYICPFCSNFTEAESDVFAFSGKKSLKFSCAAKTCRSECISIKKKSPKYTVEIECPICGGNHTFHISPSKFWDKTPFTLSCPVSGIEIFFSGTHSEIEKMISEKTKEFEDLLGEDPDEEFLEFDFIDGIYECLYEMQAAHKVSCVCGSEDIVFTLADNQIALICKRCGRTKLIEPTENTLERLESAHSLIIGN